MSFQFWERHDPDMRSLSMPKKPIPAPIKVDDGPNTPCNFMPRHSYSMMALSPATHSRRRDVEDGNTQLLTPSSDGSVIAYSPSTEEKTSDEQPTDERNSEYSRNVGQSATTTANEAIAGTKTKNDEGLTLRNFFNQSYIYDPDSRLHLQVVLSTVIIFVCLVIVIRLGIEGLISIIFAVSDRGLSVLQEGSNLVEWGLDGLGFLVGRAVAKFVHGFLRGYHLG
ncbi:hypothetical protein K505DRAFT_337029 [Melanomma pulvis-pyrius CBS 109.77]|uniref:Uncharacterized protein n=1 Tax=Melanomma pulvis-pyrius CBS 109.77 TaxID=1314802 RepID=A0A6A6XCY7_9PLEO|nr:hypothetical protein K505DRAFT_337029 [Melanomma pulvis-pyrius CBS 109.77]